MVEWENWQVKPKYSEKKPVPVPLRPPQILLDVVSKPGRRSGKPATNPWAAMQFTTAKLCIWQKKIKENLLMIEYMYETFDRSSNDDGETVRISNAYWNIPTPVRMRENYEM
jgi:hypothetical protein